MSTQPKRAKPGKSAHPYDTGIGQIEESTSSMLPTTRMAAARLDNASPTCVAPSTLVDVLSRAGRENSMSTAEPGQPAEHAIDQVERFPAADIDRTQRHRKLTFGDVRRLSRQIRLCHETDRPETRQPDTLSTNRQHSYEREGATDGGSIASNDPIPGHSGVTEPPEPDIRGPENSRPSIMPNPGILTRL